MSKIKIGILLLVSCLIIIGVPIALAGTATAAVVYVSGDGSGNYNCDGTDDHVQIQQALAYAASNPGTTVYLKGPFTYNVDPNKMYVGSHTTITGDSTAVVKLKEQDYNFPTPSLTRAMFQANSGSTHDITFHGFTIDGNAVHVKLVSGNDHLNMIQLLGSSNVTVYDMTFKNGLGDAIKVKQGSSNNYVHENTNIHIYNNIIDKIGHDGVYLMCVSKISVHDNFISCRNDAGIRLFNCKNAEIFDNEVTSENHGGAGIEIQKTSAVKINNIEIYNNNIYNIRTMGIWIYGYGTYDKSAATGVHIHHNTIRGNGLYTDEVGGIVIQGFDGTLIENNIIDGNYRAGVAMRNSYDYVSPGSGYVTILRNNIITNTKPDRSAGGTAYGVSNDLSSTHSFVMEYNCVYNPGQSNYNKVSSHKTDINVDPLFADRTAYDYHLKSKAGRWSGSRWVTDTVSSPCIDAGSPSYDYSNEPEDNGNRINIGVFGNTKYASKSGTSATNNAPVMNSVPAATVEVGKTLSFSITASDPDGDSLTYSASGLPTGATFDGNSRLFSWTPTSGQEGTYSVTFVVSDGKLKDSVTTSITAVKVESYLPQNEIYDNRLRESSPETVLQDNSYIDVGGVNDAGRYRDVMWFNLSEYAGSDINNATLSLYWYYPAGSSRPSDTIVEIYRPSSWNPSYVSWNNRDKGVSWNNAGGDWYDKNGVSQGSTPYATLTLKGSTLPDNRYYELDVTDLVKEYASGKYANTGFLIKARTESNNYIAFYSSEVGDENQRPKLTVTENVAETPTVNVTVTTTQDNRLRESSPETVLQDNSYIDVGGVNDVGKYRDVMWFNLSEYAGSDINNATLSLYWYYPAGSSRPSDTIVEIYRPSSWNPSYVSWNNRDKGVSWNNAGGDWYDKNGVSQGSTPYATLTLKGSTLPDNRYYELDVTDLVKEYASGKYANTGFLIKARTESNNYIAFYSSEIGDENQRPVLNMKVKQ
ncbi:disaggregatase related repeat-containing protein [Methanosarcina mazei]|uniref:disaggregatase related repeat-containing protein n=1 Tax=Methanosarcina mazei TaxID=2209 RepID=UPI003C78AF33